MKYKYVDENDIQERMRKEIMDMILNLKSVSEKAIKDGWSLEAEVAYGIVEIEKSMAIINYYKGLL